ncbi:MAG: hypothetical protein JWQ40_4687 [Segetibacter sp.]|nr:hypothetical protein [Segetibacter sp.]
MKLLFITAFMCCFFISKAQEKYSQKLYAYNEKSDSATFHFIYVELAPGVTPIWDTAIIDGSIYAVHATLIETIPLQLGERKKDKRMVFIRPQPDYKLWQLEFDLVEEKPASTAGTGTNKGVVLTGRVKSRKITYQVRQEVELVSRNSF